LLLGAFFGQLASISNRLLELGFIVIVTHFQVPELRFEAEKLKKVQAPLRGRSSQLSLPKEAAASRP
jgi:hypothetical protein